MASGRYMTRLVLDGNEATEVQVTLSSIVLDDVEHRTLIVSDISSLARAQRESRSKDEFLAMLAHELRNPLGAIQGAVHALAIIGHSDPMALRATGIIKRQVVHMARLVDDLLDVGRAVTGKIVLKRRARQSGRLRQVVGHHHGRRQSQLLTHRLRAGAGLGATATRCASSRSSAISSPMRSSSRSASGTVSVIRRRAKATTPCCASATRASAFRPRCCRSIFDLFVQAHHTIDRSRGGLGIGLTLVRRLAELHGGTIQADSEGDGRGSTFTVRMPA